MHIPFDNREEKRRYLLNHAVDRIKFVVTFNSIFKLSIRRVKNPSKYYL